MTELSEYLRVFPRRIVTDRGGGVWDLVPESRVADRVDALLWVDVEVDTLHDVTETSTQTEG